MKKQYQAFIALYFAIDHLYEKEPCDTTALCASELDPFLWDDIGSADPAHFVEFCEYYNVKASSKNLTAKEGFELIKEYTEKLSATFNEMYPDDKTLSSLFNKHISKDVWGEIWEQATKVATERLSQPSTPS